MEYNKNNRIGYQFQNLADAQASSKIVNDFYHSDTASTTEYAAIITCAKFGKHYIIHQDYMTNILGEPTAIEFYTFRQSPLILQQ